MKDNEIEKARKELKTLQEDIIARKRELSSLNQKKEEWFQKRAEIGSRIAEQIRDVKAKRQKRDELTQAVQEEKKERRNYSKEIRELISQVKELREKRRSQLESKTGKHVSPAALKRDIEKLEYKLETEPMPYKEERAATKKLKDLKATAKEFQGMTGMNAQIKELSERIDKLKAESDSVHEHLQEKAEESQEFHEKVIEKSKSIDELKADEDEAYKKFSELKEEYNGKREELQGVIDQADALREKLGEHSHQVARVEKKKTKEMVKKKAEAVEEKVKKGQKLTTEDLLAFQAGE